MVVVGFWMVWVELCCMLGNVCVWLILVVFVVVFIVVNVVVCWVNVYYYLNFVELVVDWMCDVG